MNFKKKLFSGSVPIIFSSGIYFSYKYSTQSKKEFFITDYNENFSFIKNLSKLKQKLYSKNIMFCGKQEKNELNFISDHEIQNTDNYLKRIEEK
jgi:hypothetical protein